MMTSQADAAARVWWDWMWPMAWQVVVLATAVLVVTLLARKRSAHLRYWLWCLVLVKLCLPPHLAFVTGIGRWGSGGTCLSHRSRSLRSHLRRRQHGGPFRWSSRPNRPPPRWTLPRQ